MIFGLLPVICGQGYFSPTNDVKEAYDLVSKLRFTEAEQKIAFIKENDPDNLLVYHVENYIDFFKVFLNEDIEEYERLKENKSKRISKINKGDENSPYYLFTLAEINLQWATARLKFGETFDPLREVYRAYKFLEKNQEKFPDFVENKKSLSIIHALSESIPGAVRFIMRVSGSIDQGTMEIRDVIKYAESGDFMYNDEAYAIYAYILFFQNNKRKEAYDVLFGADLDHSTSPLICFLKASIAQKNGNNEEALQILRERPQGEEYHDFPYLDFMYGTYRLYQLESDSRDYILSFLDNFKGRHFVKEAYQKLAWYELVENDNIAGYKKYMSLVKSEGFTLVDEDKQALKESEKGHIPDASLLKARLLFDGGYYAQAYAFLVKKAYLFPNENDQYLEFSYRMGRICHELKNLPEAIENYNYALQKGRKKNSFMACNAALQIGLILEQQGKVKQAKSYFNQCLDIESDEYKTSLHQKAKSGLNRL